MNSQKTKEKTGNTPTERKTQMIQHNLLWECVGDMVCYHSTMDTIAYIGYVRTGKKEKCCIPDSTSNYTAVCY